MEKSKRLFKNILIFLLALSATFGVLACNNLIENDANKNADLQAGNGMGVVRGTLQNENSNVRTVMPSVPSPLSYEVVATADGKTPVQAKIDGTKFEVALPYGTWILTATAKNGGNVVMKGTTEVTLNETAPNVQVEEIRLSYTTNEGSGNIELNCSYSALVDKATYTLNTIPPKSGDIIGGTFSITGIEPGSYNLVINFYAADNTILYRIDQTVNVFSNLTANKFGGTAPYIDANGNINLTEAEIKKFQLSTFYVGGTGADDGNTGTRYDPFATLARAVALVNTSPLATPTSGFNIIVQSNISAGDNITLDAGRTLSIKSAIAGTKYTITGAQNTFTANANLTTQDLIFDKMRFEAKSGNLTMTNCTITGNTTTKNGGAIYSYTGTLTVTNCEFTNNVGIRGGAISISGDDANATLKLNGTTKFEGNTGTYGNAIYLNYTGTLELSGDVTFATNDDIYLAKNGSVMKPITITGNLITATAGSIKITPAIYANGIPVLTDSSSGTLVVANFTKFAVTDQNDGGTIKKWAVDNEGKLDGSTKYATVYLKGTGGDDGKDGSTEANAVASLAKALSRLDTTATTPKIIVASAYTLKSGEEGLLNRAGATGNKVTIERGTETGAVMEISSGDVTIANVIFDGKKDDYTADNALLRITDSSTKVTIGDGTILKDNNNNKSGINGGGIYNEGILTINGGKISGNESGNNSSGGGIYNNGTLTINGGEISGNTADYGGGIRNKKTLTIIGGKISDNTANTNGGGISNDGGTVTISGGTISGNLLSGSTGKGKGIYNNTTLEMSDAAQIDSTNEVYLSNGKFITVTGNLTATGTVASIILDSSPTQYKAGTQVLDLTAIAAANRVGVCGKFKLLNPDGTENTELAIKPDSTDSKKGVLATSGSTSGGIQIGTKTYALTLTVTTTGGVKQDSILSTGSAINVSDAKSLSLKVKDVSTTPGTEITTGIFTITIMQTDGTVIAESATNSLVVDYLPADTYKLYLKWEASAGSLENAEANNIKFVKIN